MSWFLPLAMMGAGVLKNELVDRPRSQALARAEAAKTFYSPWTGMQGQTVMPPSSLDAAMKWGLTGAMLKQKMDVNERPEKKQENQVAMSPWSFYNTQGMMS